MPAPTWETSGFHAMAKPGGSRCNMQCAYCFYLEKAALYPDNPVQRMGDATLESYIREYIAAVPNENEVAFTWQGGEPTLMGLGFYRNAVTLQERYGRGRRMSNSFQTNGIALDAEWCAFFASHDFLVGLSLDGPADIHDAYRVTAGGKPTHALVMRSLDLLRRHRVRYNVLACVNRRSSQEPDRVYDFLRRSGVEFIQFIPIVERIPTEGEIAAGLSLRAPQRGSPGVSPDDVKDQMTDWSVLPEDYGQFLIAIFDLWRRRDVGRVFVMNFEWALANFLGRPGAACHHQPVCGRAVVVEHNGDVYPCDHYVYPECRLGNINEQAFASMINASLQEQFGTAKFSALSKQCKQCNMINGCWGGCPKHRFVSSRVDELAVNYLCPGYHRFFKHVAPYFKVIKDFMDQGRPITDIMRANFFAVRNK